MFEDRTYENILNEMLAQSPADTDIRQGSVYYDMCAPAAFEISKYYTDLNTTIELTALDTAVGEYLDEKAAEHNVYRLPATSNIRNVTFVGAAVTAGKRFFADNQYFITELEDLVIVVAETPGETANNIPTGTTLIPVTAIAGLTSATLEESISLGTEEETDDNLRRRVKEKIANESANGNRQHYKSWCEERAGVGIARIKPLWDGDNTVQGVLVGADGLSVSQSIVDDVQEYIDPGSTGLGDGVANIGAYFTAATAIENTINISFDVVLDVSIVLQDVIDSAELKIIDFFKILSLSNGTDASYTVRLSAIANIIYDIEGVIDYNNLLLNAGTANITIPYTDVPVLGALNIVQI